jgi:hypothetical protein
MGNPVCLHYGGKPSVVNLLSMNSEIHDELTPQGEGCREVCEELNQSLKDFQSSVCFGNGKPKPSAGSCRACANVPELGHVLRCRDQFVPSGYESTNGCADGCVLGVGPLHQPQKNATIGQNEH